MDENEIIVRGGETPDEPVTELVTETPLPDLSETTRYTDEYLAFLAFIENGGRREIETAGITESVESIENTEYTENIETAENEKNTDNE